MKHIRNILAGLAGLTLAGAMILLPAGAASAATSGIQAVTADVTSGSLSITAPTAISGSVTLSGSDNYVDTNLSVNANDNTGTGNGWGVTVVSSPLEFTPSGATKATVAGSGWSLVVEGLDSANQPLISPTGSGTYTLPSDTTDLPNNGQAVPGIHGATSPTPATVFSAEAGTGMGDFSLTEWETILTVPANAIAGNYSGTVTWAITSGP